MFKKSLERKMFKHDSFSLTKKQCGFHKTNAPDVYSVSAKVLFKEDYKKVFEELNGIKSAHINDEVCFRLEEGVWKITDKIKGH